MTINTSSSTSLCTPRTSSPSPSPSMSSSSSSSTSAGAPPVSSSSPIRATDHDVDQQPQSHLLSLPIELVQRIIDLGTPVWSFKHAQDRLTWFNSLSLTCRAFHQIVKQDLGRHVIVQCGTSQDVFRTRMTFVRNVVSPNLNSIQQQQITTSLDEHDLLDDSEEPTWAEPTRRRSNESRSTTTSSSCQSNLSETLQSVRLRYDQVATEQSLRLFKSTWSPWPCLRELWIVGEPVGVTWLTMTSLRELAPTLEILCLDNVGLLESESLALPALSFPQLCHLSISNPIVFPDNRAASPWTPFLHPTRKPCPKLVSIVLTCWTHTLHTQQLENLIESIQSISNQLKRFTFNPTAGLNFQSLLPLWKSFLNIEYIGLPVPVVNGFNDVKIVLNSVQSFKNLKHIRLFTHFKPDNEWQENDWSQLLQLVKDCILVDKTLLKTLTIPKCLYSYLLNELNDLGLKYGVKVLKRNLPFEEYVDQWEDLVVTGFGFDT
ncbi:hypothetical protein OIO90_002937 [Microbotryomycetes sp. JL221]|nr:hypothetical protein OIO90_002937 [Microbotryomycetes sp. JL221]